MTCSVCGGYANAVVEGAFSSSPSSRVPVCDACMEASAVLALPVGAPAWECAPIRLWVRAATLPDPGLCWLEVSTPEDLAAGVRVYVPNERSRPAPLEASQ